MLKPTRLTLDRLKLLNILVIIVTVAICSILMLLRLPGMELLEVHPNWLLIWVVVWSIKRTPWQGAIAGIAMGCIYDGLTMDTPSHILSLAVVGVFTARLQKQKYIGEDFISVASIVFLMVVLAEGIYALEYSWQQILPIDEVWQYYQKIVITSALITSLWSPVLYYPCDLWWSKIRQLEQAHEIKGNSIVKRRSLSNKI
jgi:rod shape-determining protein MreD